MQSLGMTGVREAHEPHPLCAVCVMAWHAPLWSSNA